MIILRIKLTYPPPGDAAFRAPRKRYYILNQAEIKPGWRFYNPFDPTEGGSNAGRVNQKTAPSPGLPVLSTPTVPPSLVMIRRVIDSPRPCPPTR
jgi:hypothetical protein